MNKRLFKKTENNNPSQPSLGKGRSKVGFTLAEVLITLGIIGVVAALTMPTLISNYQKQVLVNQLKANSSLLSQGFQKMMADEEVTWFNQTEFWNECVRGTVDKCHETFKKYFNVVKENEYNTNTYKTLNCNFSTNICSVSNFEYINPQKYDYVLTNGAFINLSMYAGILEVGIDVNGSKGPNIHGLDIQRFMYNVVDSEFPRLFGNNILINIISNGWKFPKY